MNISVIIKSITIQTLYLNSMWYPPQSSIGGFINQTIFIVLSALTAFNFFMAAIVGPGWIPYGWKPNVREPLKCDNSTSWLIVLFHSFRKISM